MQESATRTKPLEMGCLENKNVITTDGRIVGVLSGAWVDTSTWTVTSIIIELEKNVVDELNVKKPLLRTAKVTVPTSTVLNIVDVVQLSIGFGGLGSVLNQQS